MDGSSQSPPPPKPSEQAPRRGLFSSNFRKFFVRGLAIILPTVLTIWILAAAYQFVSYRIAEPINQGMRELVIRITGYPAVTEEAVDDFERCLLNPGHPLRDNYRAVARRDDEAALDAWLERTLRRQRLESFWQSYAIVLNAIGLIVAVVLIYFIGIVLGSFIGRRLHKKGEDLLHRVPLIRNIYPSVKQVTDFFVGNERERIQFNRVVAVEYPRKGLWSVGLVTGDTMAMIQSEAGMECLTVFIPSSPTPFTGYVITVPRADSIDLPITIEEAMKFAVSGGVLIPPNQKITRDENEDAKLGGETAAEPASSGGATGPRPR